MSDGRRVEISVGVRNFARPLPPDASGAPGGPGPSGRADSAQAVTAAMWSSIGEQVAAYEELGVDRIVVSDHVVFGEDLSAYGDPEAGGILGGVQPTGPDGVWLEPLTVLAFLAARTSRIRLATGIVLAALRRPVVLAKVAATLDSLSGGRLDLGVGVGWQRAEYEAAQLRFEDRGRLLDATLDVCARLWSGEPVDLPGVTGPVRVQSHPRPVAATVPIWVSGSVSGPVVRRTARFGSGWIPWGPAITDPVAGLESFRARLREELDRLAASGERTVLADAEDLRAAVAVRVAGVGDRAELERAVGEALLPVPELLEAGYTDLRLSVGASVVPVVDVVSEFVTRLDRVVDR